MKKQYLIQKYVLANSVTEAIDKSKNLPIHEVYVHGSWFEKVANYEWNKVDNSNTSGFKAKKSTSTSNRVKKNARV